MMAVAVSPVGAQSAGPDFQVTLNPPDGQSVGNSVNIHIKVYSTNPGATRISVSCGGVSKGETSEVEFDSSWNTGGCSSGNQQITIQARNPDDPNWSNPNTKTFNYNLTGTQQPPIPPKGPNISIFDFSPSSAYVGDSVTIHIKVDSTNPGATKLTASCGSLTKNETSEVEFYTTWNTSGCPVGTATVSVLSRDVNDPNWANPSSATRSYGLSAPPVPVLSPTANFWTDSNSILQGQCTNLHWDTANAVSVDIDRSGVNSSGSRQVCPGVTQKFTLTAHAASGGVDASRNLTITVTAVTQPPAVVDSFQTGNVISIGGNIYVIVDGRRRHVPNPATLDALGISQSLINNKGFSDSQLSQIIQGPDIPDVNIDPTGVASFRAAYLPNLTPIVPNPTKAPTAMPTLVVPTVQPTAVPTVQPQSSTDPQTGEVLPSPCLESFINNLAWIDMLTGVIVVHAKSESDFIQCVNYVRTHRSDVGDIHGDGGKWADLARAQGFDVVSGDMTQARTGDIVVWSDGCAITSAGHVAILIYAEQVGQSVTKVHVNDANHFVNGNLDGQVYHNYTYDVGTYSGCMSLIHMKPGATVDLDGYAPPSTTTKPSPTTCNQYAWWDPRGWWCWLFGG